MLELPSAGLRTVQGAPSTGQLQDDLVISEQETEKLRVLLISATRCRRRSYYY